MPNTENDIPIYSINNIIETYKLYDSSDETKEIILYFLSELTGLSIDSLLNLM